MPTFMRFALSAKGRAKRKPLSKFSSVRPAKPYYNNLYAQNRVKNPPLAYKFRYSQTVLFDFGRQGLELIIDYLLSVLYHI